MPVRKPSTLQKIKMQPVTHATGKHLPFPPEIRDRIYRLVLAHGKVPATMLQWASEWPPGAGILAILLVSKQTYLEAFHILYRETCITVLDTSMLYTFLKNIGYARRQNLTALEFSYSGKDPKTAFRLLKTCQNLRSLSIDLLVGDRGPPVAWHALREVRGLENVRFKVIRCNQCRCVWHRAGDQTNIHPAVRSIDDLVQHLTEGMTRPRLKKYSADPNKKIDLFKGKSENFRESEEAGLKAETDRLMENQNSWKFAGTRKLP